MNTSISVDCYGPQTYCVKFDGLLLAAGAAHGFLASGPCVCHFVHQVLECFGRAVVKHGIALRGSDFALANEVVEQEALLECVWQRAVVASRGVLHLDGWSECRW